MTSHFQDGGHDVITTTGRGRGGRLANARWLAGCQSFLVHSTFAVDLKHFDQKITRNPVYPVGRTFPTSPPVCTGQPPNLLPDMFSVYKLFDKRRHEILLNRS